MKISFGNIVLCRGVEESESPSEFRIDSEKSVQVASFLRSDQIKTFPRGNHRTVVRFKVVRKHKSIAEAADHVLIHASELQDMQSTLVMQVEGIRPLYLLNASIKNVSSNVLGITSSHEYEIIGGKVAREK